MKTYRDCVPCFFKQALDAARLAGAKPTLQEKILLELSRRVLKFNFASPPTEMGRLLYALVRKRTGTDDPFKELKRKSNQFALALYPRLRKKVAQSKDRLLSAVELAIAGNIIDYGTKGSLDIARELENICAEEDKIIRRQSKSIFDYPSFKQALNKARKVLYIADNAGEVVFDRILIEQINKEVIYAVREQPVINDALVADALTCGIHKQARIVSTGCAAPGVNLRSCTSEFRKIYRHADLIISKGQGNFESLGDQSGPIFFLFRAKCAVVAKHLGCKLGAIILKRAKR